jgi:hypothetical protein
MPETILLEARPKFDHLQNAFTIQNKLKTCYTKQYRVACGGGKNRI